MNRYRLLAIVAAVMTITSAAHAETTLEERLAAAEQRLAALESSGNDEQDITINGFMTFAMERMSRVEDAATGETLVYQYEVGNEDWNLNRLTRAGVQINGRISDKAKAVVQLLGRASDNFNAEVQWAYVSYDINDSLTARAGRLMLPFYLHSQYTQVGYAYPWVELPSEMYSVIPMDTYEGIDLTWNFNTGAINNSVNVFWGGMDVPLESVVFEGRNQHGINITSNLGNWTGWYSYTNGEVSVDLSNTLENAYGVPAIASSGLNMDHNYVYFTGLGLQYDNGSLFVMGERGRLDMSSPANWFPTLDSLYVTAGYRLGKLTPHLTWSRIEHSSIDDVDTGNPLAGVATVLFQSFGDQQKSWTLGTRYDLTPGVSLKAEASYYYGFAGSDYDSKGVFDAPSGNPLVTPDPDGDNPVVYRLAVETVF